MQAHGIGVGAYSVAPNIIGPATITGTLDVTGATSTGALTTTVLAIGAVSTNAVVGNLLVNTTAAAAGAQQYSPAHRLSGRGWSTDAGGASMSVDWLTQCQPVQGTAAPTGRLVVLASVNGAAYAAVTTTTSAGWFGVGTVPAGRTHVISEATTSTPTAFGADHLGGGRPTASGTGSGGVFLQYNSTADEGLIGSLSPAVAWRPLKFSASAWAFNYTGSTTVVAIAGGPSSGVNLTITQPTTATGAPSVLVATAGVNATGYTASTEVTDYNLNASATKTWATGRPRWLPCTSTSLPTHTYCTSQRASASS